MPRESRKNVGESVRARLLQRSRDERTDFQVLLTRYPGVVTTSSCQTDNH